MKAHIQTLRAALHARTLDIQEIGRTRELSLALTTCQQARMLLGVVLKLQGETTPYPQADNPESPEIAPPADVAPVTYEPTLSDDPVAAVKEVRRRIEVTLEELSENRRILWARDYGSLAEVVYGRAYTELALTKNWLGMQLARLAEEAKPKSAPLSV